MTIRLSLLCAAAGPAVREARFGHGLLDERGMQEARTVAGALPEASLRYRAPSARCEQTTKAVGIPAAVEPALRDCDFGRWSGRKLEDVAATDPEGISAWMTDPDATPHGGESMSSLLLRVGIWMDSLPEDSGRVLAVVEPAVVRAAAVHALNAPPAALWRVDVPPLSLLTLTGRAGRWNLRLSVVCPLPGAPSPGLSP
ncbi:histidine phosphatase family protein [Streptomyces marianii]|uniref:Histidine phosphatase family protein n=1 Tax=Streptomyces marianii TaxID=1817406 RepID=A0A5R9E2W9_9ACTN|nr:histidine phosphatase family protein [Streptomyces marianii]TLQ42363.1 histidine phosphatase family protein [Streptomyces marianii]